MKTLYPILVLLLLTSCSVSEKNSGETTPIDTSVVAQARFKAEWINNTKGKYFSGNANLFGGGANTIDFAFDPSNGYLFNSFKDFPGWYPLHKIILFKSGSQTIVKFDAGAGAAFVGHIYSLEIQEDGLYRTQNIIGAKASGWTTIDKWDGKTYSQAYLEKIASLKPSKPTLRPDWDK